MSNNAFTAEFLNYYLKLKAPGYAVLLRGKWGCGKTWFVKQYRDAIGKNKTKWVFISLYGIRSTQAIDDEIFRQVHPILGSKAGVLAGRLAGSALKAAVRVDLWPGDDGEATVGATLPK